jgi:hypothetical protein
MTQAIVAQVNAKIGAGGAVPAQPGEADVTAEQIWARALSYCAGKMSVEDSHVVLERMRQGDSVVSGYCLYSVARQVAQVIGSLDESVRAVYIFDCEATPEDECLGEVARGVPLLHLLVWTQRRTAALRALVTSLDGALVRAYASVLGQGALASLLDVQVIDDADVGRRSGYGALLSSMYHRPIQVWQR